MAACFADVLDVSPLAARLAFVALSFAGGAGVALYVAAWLLLPPAQAPVSIAQRAMADRRTISLVLAGASLIAALMVTAASLGSDTVLGWLSPGAVSLAGLIAIWRQADEQDRTGVRHLLGLFSGSPQVVSSSQAHWRFALIAARLALGLGLLVLGTSSLVAPQHVTGADLRAGLDALAVLCGCALVLAPWWSRVARELAGERRARARAQERAEMAEHLHDSVLQTLALIQRSAQDPHKVVSLARAQERQLRRWLFDNVGPDGPGIGDAGTMAEALALVQQEVETAHDIKVELVTVGDAQLTQELRAVVAAAREAVVNAAKWSGAGLVSVFCEVEPGHVSVFVLDRGQGFDPARVASDRKGVSESIVARVSRRGGTAHVRSTLGEGTEVTIKMPRREQG